MKVFWILLWSCQTHSSSRFTEKTYEVFTDSSTALRNVANGNHSNCYWEIYQATGNFVIGSKP